MITRFFCCRNGKPKQQENYQVCCGGWWSRGKNLFVEALYGWTTRHEFLPSNGKWNRYSYGAIDHCRNLTHWCIVLPYYEGRFKVWLLSQINLLSWIGVPFWSYGLCVFMRLYFFITDMGIRKLAASSGQPLWYENIIFDIESCAIAQMKGCVILNNK